jgi:hypothetical protein
MAKKKTVDELSAEELYELAKKREAEEREREREAMRAEVDKLKAERREMLKRHRREVAEIDARIRKLTGRGARSAGISASVLEILGDKKQHSTKDIKAALAKRGLTAGNLAQTMAYLKRQGKVKSPKRSVYTLA